MSAPAPLAPGPLLAFYGDDVTGSSASMEAFAWQGIRTVLFLEVPSAERLAQFPDFQCIGIAGIARSKDPAWMDANLPAIFERLAQTGAPVIQYKACSTFDSSPHVGSIGRAADIATRLIPGPVPMLVGDLGMGRLQAFGNLFAQAHGSYYRLDRHPTMANHPSTPMQEADLGRHLAGQTAIPVSNVSFIDLKGGQAADRIWRQSEGETRIFSLDLLDQETSRAAGQAIWAGSDRQRFVIGSQGVQSALAAYWRSEGLLTTPPVQTTIRPVDRVAAVSGSVSPMTAEQIGHALANGFRGIRLDLRHIVDDRAWADELYSAGIQARAALSEGYDPLIFTATGPTDPAVAAVKEMIHADPQLGGKINDRIGASLGQILNELVRQTGLTRVVLAGGDTSSHAALNLDVDALTSVAKLAPGGPLCRAHSQDPARDGLEIALKGGQVGTADYFVTARDGQ